MSLVELRHSNCGGAGRSRLVATVSAKGVLVMRSLGRAPLHNATRHLDFLESRVTTVVLPCPECREGLKVKVSRLREAYEAALAQDSGSPTQMSLSVTK